MSSAVEQLLALVGTRAALEADADEVAALQLRAAQKRLEQRRSQLLILDARANDAGVERIRTWEEMIPLLFAHTTYKSYPQKFVDQGRWEPLLRWFNTLTTAPVRDLDFASVTDIDGWVAALWAAGHPVYATSGTSGKSSFLPVAPTDLATVGKVLPVNAYWPAPMPAKNSLRWYQLFPRSGSYSGVHVYRAMSETLGKPGTITYLSDCPLTIADTARAVRMHTAMRTWYRDPERHRRVRAGQQRAGSRDVQSDRPFRP